MDKDWDTIISSVIKDSCKNLSLQKCKYKDIILNDFIHTHQKQIIFAYRLKFIQMKLGDIWQKIMGYVDGIDNLGIGHKSGLDLKTSDNVETNKWICELKNSYNTDNSSSKHHNIKKLTNFVRENPEYQAIYAFVNSKNEEGDDVVVYHDDIPIRFLSGKKLLQFIFKEQYQNIVALFKHNLQHIIVA
jgi:uncharacterized protein YlaN (UPF0358 family)